jgi:hypothetical protein
MMAPVPIQSRLEAGERLLWWDRPKQGLLLRKADALLIPFSLLWGGFAFFWEFSVTRMGTTPWFFKLWGIPFVLAGIYLIVGRFFYDAWRRNRLVYGLTQDRILLATPSSCRSLALESLGEINLEEAGDGKGSIAFGREPPYTHGGLSGWGGWTGAPSVPTFEGIPEARRVFTAIRQAQKKASARD